MDAANRVAPRRDNNTSMAVISCSFMLAARWPHSIDSVYQPLIKLLLVREKSRLQLGKLNVHLFKYLYYEFKS